MKYSSSENSLADNSIAWPFRCTWRVAGSSVRPSTSSTVGRSEGPRRMTERTRARSSLNEKGFTR